MRLLRLLYTVPLRLRSLFRRDQVERDLEDEFRDHLERRIEADVARGMAPDEARYAALRAFGGIDQRKEECRDMRHVNFVDHGIQDLRFALRQLLKHRGFACTAIGVLTLGIAGSATIFGFVDAALIRPLPYGETAARRHFPDDDPLGRSIAFGSPASPAREIVGIVADIKDGPPETPPHPSAYVPFDQPGFGLVIRTSASGPAIFPSLVAAIREIRSDALVGDVATMANRTNRLPSTSLQRSSAWLLGAFAAMAFVLSIVGLYGVVAYSVGQRTREIGVRMALGAQRGSLYRLVLGEASRVVGLGTALGVICAVTAASMMRHLLFGVQAWDLPTLAAAAVAIIIAALLASYIPARRAASLNPIEVLRAE